MNNELSLGITGF